MQVQRSARIQLILEVLFVLSLLLLGLALAIDFLPLIILATAGIIILPVAILILLFTGRETNQGWSRLVWGILFALSLLALVFFLPRGPSAPVSAPTSPFDSTTGVLTIVSFLTSLLTFIGLVSTTVIAWRKEKRESKAADLARQREEIELEKAKLELEKLKAEQSKTS